LGGRHSGGDLLADPTRTLLVSRASRIRGGQARPFGAGPPAAEGPVSESDDGAAHTRTASVSRRGRSAA